MKRGGYLKRRARRVPGTKLQRERFHRETLMRATSCPVADDGVHEGELQAHHVTSQEAIKDRAATLRLEERDVAELLWDPTNGLAVCRRHHERHTLARRRLPLAAVSIDARRFAAALGLEHLIDRYYRTKEGAC